MYEDIFSNMDTRFDIITIRRIASSIHSLVNVDLDHTADVQFHVWGPSLNKAFENIAPCMANYITDLSTVTIDENTPVEFKVTGIITFISHLVFLERSCIDSLYLNLNTAPLILLYLSLAHDMHSLLFAYMDEMLFRFSTDGFICARVEIIEFDKDKYKLTLKG